MKCMYVICIILFIHSMYFKNKLTFNHDRSKCTYNYEKMD